MYKVASSFKSHVYYRIKLINYLSRNKRKRLGMGELKKTCLDLYLKFNVDRYTSLYTCLFSFSPFSFSRLFFPVILVIILACFSYSSINFTCSLSRVFFNFFNWLFSRAKHDYNSMENYVSSTFLNKIQSENAAYITHLILF